MSHGSFLDSQLLADLTSGSSDPFGGAFSPNAGNSAASSDSNFANFDEANFDAPPLGKDDPLQGSNDEWISVFVPSGFTLAPVMPLARQSKYLHTNMTALRMSENSTTNFSHLKSPSNEPNTSTLSLRRLPPPPDFHPPKAYLPACGKPSGRRCASMFASSDQQLPPPLLPIKPIHLGRAEKRAESLQKKQVSKSNHYTDLEGLFVAQSRPKDSTSDALARPFTHLPQQFDVISSEASKYYILRPELGMIPPEIPYKTPILRRPVTPESGPHGQADEYTNCVKAEQKRPKTVTFDPQPKLSYPAFEVEIPKQLAPKKLNPSLPNLSQLRTQVDEDNSGMSMNCLNPFSPNYCPSLLKKNQNIPENDKSRMFKLGEEFFVSLFDKSNECNNRLTCASNTETLHPPSSGVSLTTSSQPMGILPTAGKQQKSQEKSHKAPEDRYAALKDLDEIFRSSMAIKDQGMHVTCEVKHMLMWPACICSCTGLPPVDWGILVW